MIRTFIELTVVSAFVWTVLLWVFLFVGGH